MKTNHSFPIAMAFLLSMGIQVSAQSPGTPTGNDESLPNTALVSVSASPAGAIWLSGEDLPPISIGQPGVDPAPDMAALGCHCFGHVSDSPDCYSTGAIGSDYNTNCNVNTQNHKADCCGRIKNALASLTAAQKKTIEDCLCSSNKAAGPVFAYYGIGTKPYEQCDNKIGTLNRPPAYDVTSCKCPSGWLSDTNVDGGVTTDGKCKKMVCTWDAAVFPPPNPGVLVGTWGFTWQNGIWAFGTAANGGAAVCSTVHHPPGPCSFTWN